MNTSAVPLHSSNIKVIVFTAFVCSAMYRGFVLKYCCKCYLTRSIKRAVGHFIFTTEINYQNSKSCYLKSTVTSLTLPFSYNRPRFHSLDICGNHTDDGFIRTKCINDHLRFTVFVRYLETYDLPTRLIHVRFPGQTIQRAIILAKNLRWMTNWTKCPKVCDTR